MATAGSSLPARPGRKNATGYETGSNDTGLMAIFTETWSGKFRGHDVRQRRIELLNRQYTFIGPCAPEALLDAPNAEARFAADGYMPYWAEFWPASLLLMDAVASWAPPGPGAPPVKVLELGCGLGAVSVVLGSLGYRAIASDYDQDALAFTLENARINPEEVDFISAHATSTKMGDIVEAQAIHAEYGDRPHVSGLKSYIGHTMSSCGAIETIFVLYMLQEGFMVPTLNLEEVDPRCNMVRHVTKILEKQINIASIQNFAFGGVNTILFIQKWT